MSRQQNPRRSQEMYFSHSVWGKLHNIKMSLFLKTAKQAAPFSCAIWPPTMAPLMVSRFGLALRHLAGMRKDFGLIPLRLSLLFKKVVVCGHCLVTLSITSYWNIKMALIAAHLNAGIILMVTCSDRYIISLFTHLHTPFPTFSSSLINSMVSVDVEHHVYFATDAASTAGKLSYYQLHWAKVSEIVQQTWRKYINHTGPKCQRSCSRHEGSISITLGQSVRDRAADMKEVYQSHWAKVSEIMQQTEKKVYIYI